MKTRKTSQNVKRRILFAMASPSHVRKIRAMLGSDDFSFSSALDPNAAIERLKKKKFDVIILDAAPWRSNRKVPGRKIMKAASGRPIIVLTEGGEATAKAMKAFGHNLWDLSWEYVDGELLKSTISSAVSFDQERVALREGEERFSKIFQLGPGLYIISRVKNGLISDVNEAWLAAFGFRRKEVIGKTTLQLNLWRNPKDRKRFVKEMTEKGSVRGFEVSLCNKKGDPLELFVDGELTEINGEQHLLLIAFDITERLKIERALRESEERARAAEKILSNALDNMSEGFVLYDKEGRLVISNQTWMENYNYTAATVRPGTSIDEMAKLDVENKIFDENWTSKEEYLKVRHRHRRQLKGSLEIKLRDGRWLSIRERRTADGGVVGIQTDITEFKRVEEKLRKTHEDLELRIHERTRQLRGEVEERKRTMVALAESEQRQRDIAESATDWQWETDNKFRYTYLSHNFQSSLKIDPGKVMGKSRLKYITRGDDPSAEQWRDHINDLKNHRPFRDFTYEFNHPDGYVQYITASGKPNFDEKGKFCGFRGTASNITAKVEAEKNALSAQRQLSDAIEGISDALILFDANDRLVMCNGRYREMFSALEDKLVPGLEFRKLARFVSRSKLITDAVASPDKWLKDRLAHHANPGKSYEQRLESGQWINFLEYRTRDGETLILLTDVTALRQAEHDLREARDQAEVASRAKSDFLAGMSHELRTPLNAIIGFSDAIRSQLYGPVLQAQYADYVDHIHDSGIHLLELINDILDISKIEAGAIELDESRFKVDAIINRAFSLVKDQAKDGSIRIKKVLPTKLPSLIADERRVIQVLLNLLSNAIKFTPAGGEVKITAGQENDGGMVVRISDTGIGIKKGDIEKVMTDFGQANNSLAKKNEGTGLGLPLSKGLMEMHEGTLKIESKIHKGTLVTIRFPSHRVGK
jgi:PAS domain S-box-containing protein